MDTKSDEHFLAIEATIESHNQEADTYQVNNDEKLTTLTENLQKLTTFIMDQTKISKSSPAQKDTSTPPDPTIVVQTNRRAPPLEGEHYNGMWTLKHDIISPEFYELLTKTELKGDTALDLNNFFSSIKRYLNAVNRLREDLFPDYQSIKRNSEFEE